MNFSFPTTHLSNDTIDTYLTLLAKAPQPVIVASLVHTNCQGAWQTMVEDFPLNKALEESLWSGVLEKAPFYEMVMLKAIRNNRKPKESLSEEELRVFTYYETKVLNKFLKGEQALRNECDSYKSDKELPAESEEVYLNHLCRNAKRVMMHKKCFIEPENFFFFLYIHGNRRLDNVIAYQGVDGGSINRIGSVELEQTGIKHFPISKDKNFVRVNRGTEILDGVSELDFDVESWIEYFHDKRSDLSTKVAPVNKSDSESWCNRLQDDKGCCDRRK